MSEQQELKIPLTDVIKSIQLVTAVLNDVDIPAKLAADWVTAGRVLNMLETWMERKNQEHQALVAAQAKAEDVKDV